LSEDLLPERDAVFQTIDRKLIGLGPRVEARECHESVPDDEPTKHCLHAPELQKGFENLPPASGGLQAAKVWESTSGSYHAGARAMIA
jgi:hypothetical protein